jgi:uncharacterized membrane protein
MDSRALPQDATGTAPRPRGFDMDVLVGSILLIGVMAALALLLAGALWHWAIHGTMTYDFPLRGTNLLDFVAAEVRDLLAGKVTVQVVISLGIAVLLMTPYVRVLASMLYFIFQERNLKYSLFTAFVLGVLTYSLMLH